MSWIAPRESREWFARWSANFAAWQVLRERGELGRRGIFDFWGPYRESFRDAWHARLKTPATQAVLNGPAFVVAAGVALLILMGIGTHGYRGARSYFRTIPIENPAALVSIDYPSRPSARAAALARLIPLWRAQSIRARDIAGYRYAYRYSRAWVSWNFFSTVGVKPAAGRLFQAGDRDAAVLSYPAWRALYGGDPRIVGTRIVAGGQSYTVVGVLPELFWALSPSVDVWVPLDLATPPPGPGFLVGAVARLRAGGSEGQLRTELSGIERAASAGLARPVRLYSFANRLPGPGMDLYLIGTLFAGISCLVLVVREHTRGTAHGWRYWPFLGAKILLAVSIPLLVWMEADSVVRTFRPALGPAAVFAGIGAALVFLVTCVLGLWWSFADQRRRCPVCLQKLAMPVSVGSPASIFEPGLTELVCPNGHGALSLADDEADRHDRWIALDSSWNDLFHDKTV